MAIVAIYGCVSELTHRLSWRALNTPQTVTIRVKPRRSVRSLVASALLTVFAHHTTHAAPGDLDDTFGVGANGKVPAIAVGAGSYDVANAALVQPDGKILLAGACTNASNKYDFCLARLLPNGDLDSDFDGPGGNGNGRFTLSVTTGDNFAYAMALQSDGKILLAGGCEISSVSTIKQFCVARLNTDGTLDTTFDGPAGNGNGRSRIDVNGATSVAYAMALQPNGRIVLAGYCDTGSYNVFCLARLNASDGSLDTTFDGPNFVSPGNGVFELPRIGSGIGGGGDEINATALQPDGKIVLAGRCWDNDMGYRFCVARLNTNGTWDTTFDGPDTANPANGRFLFSIPSMDGAEAKTIALQPDGMIVVAGGCGPSSSIDRQCFARFEANGRFDTRFDGPSGGGGGRFSLTFGNVLNEGARNTLILQADGKIVRAVSCAASSQVDSDFCMFRLHSDGTIDKSLANGLSIKQYPIGNNSDGAFALAMQSDGKFVIAGTCSPFRFCAARIDGGPFAAKQCSLDIDGDGRVLATTDMLIGTRVALGMTGSAVINGISFAANAARDEWGTNTEKDIRKYLITQCGMSISP